MCGGVIYYHNNQLITVYFPNPKASLPVKKKNGEQSLVLWGRRNNQEGSLPIGGWARLDSIHQGRWDKYFPKPVKIPALKFMEKDLMGVSHWFDVIEGQWIQGLLAQHGQEERVYVVTIAPEHEAAIHERWPRILND